ncbi:Hypothetical predicted protein [Olea europaea subsp. europaea]|uniref:Rhamnogalacturonan lyase domain-containing protein n=1 Tax=Olea europaea subsp. europaea TaxID=158383 RepID=A0A8S0QDE0_OLEEU|nr:Hypothetical predicted protein [Olea europaea subsp. europaea]
MGDYKYETDIVVTPGSQIKLGNLVYNPPRNGPTLWEIGIPDRIPAEFYVPDPSPELRNNVFTKQNQKYRQYGLWDRYTDLYPEQDLVYTVGTSDYRKDWFFAHVNRRTNNTFQSTAWQVSFNLTDVAEIMQLRDMDYMGYTHPITSVFRDFDSFLEKHTIYLKQSRGATPFNGVMYDYIRFEGPPEVRL